MIPWGVAKKWSRWLVVAPVKIYCGYHLFATHVAGPRMVFGASMLPTFSASTEWIIEDALSVHLGRPLTRGELVVLDSPRNPSDQICKRIIGLPGDVVCVDPSGTDAMSKEHVIIPPGHIWIVGDNAAASRDSREYGPVPIALVRSRVFARVPGFRTFLMPWKTQSTL